MEYLLYSEQDILERVDEYSLYCLYLGYEPLIGAKYLSPFREENDPSFGIYESTKRKIGCWEFVWKDSGDSSIKAGNIFDLVQRLFSYETKLQAFLRVMADTGIGGTSDNKERIYIQKEKKYAEPIDIAIASRPFLASDYNYWRQGNISPEILKQYGTKAIKMYWITEQQKTPDFPKVPGYAYPIYNKYQLYFPTHPEKKKKFRHNYTDACIHGFKELQYDSDTLIITKSRKDVMLLRSFGYESIAPRSESTLVPEEFMQHFREKYPRRLILFDNDGKHRGDEYPEPKIFVPKLMDTDKDPFDFARNHGVQACAEMLRQIIGRP